MPRYEVTVNFKFYSTTVDADSLGEAVDIALQRAKDLEEPPVLGIYSAHERIFGSNPHRVQVI